MSHLTEAAKVNHEGLYGVLIYFYLGKDGCESKYVFLSDKKIIENQEKHRPVRPECEDTYNLMDNSLSRLLDGLAELQLFV